MGIWPGLSASSRGGMSSTWRYGFRVGSNLLRDELDVGCPNAIPRRHTRGPSARPPARPETLAILAGMDVGSVVVAVGVVVAAYFIGGIPWGVVVARMLGGPDPRSLGSGRTGGANVMRAAGPGAALLAGLLDAGKGALSVLIAIAVGAGPTVEALAAIAAIVGHSRSPYIGFQGGRGVAPGWGGLLVIQPVVALAVVPIFAAIVLITRISSLASLATTLVAAFGVALAVVLLEMPPVFVAYAIASAAIIWLFHADNIQRLMNGQERRINWRSGGQR
jgi:glycerol-3-phosphate acyltransferase PlsY